MYNSIRTILLLIVQCSVISGYNVPGSSTTPTTPARTTLFALPGWKSISRRNTGGGSVVEEGDDNSPDKPVHTFFNRIRNVRKNKDEIGSSGLRTRLKSSLRSNIRREPFQRVYSSSRTKTVTTLKVLTEVFEKTVANRDEALETEISTSATPDNVVTVNAESYDAQVDFEDKLVKQEFDDTMVHVEEEPKAEIVAKPEPAVKVVAKIEEEVEEEAEPKPVDGVQQRKEEFIKMYSTSVDPSDRAFAMLLELDMIEVNLDPEDPLYDDKWDALYAKHHKWE